MLAGSLLLSLSALAAAALQPPPPALVPAEFERTVDGYDIGRFYQNWVVWIERRKHDALQSMLGEPEEIAGESFRHQPIIEYSWVDQAYGANIVGDIHAYCRFDDRYRLIAGSCHYRLRQVSNLHEAAEPNDPLARWARQSFDPEALVRRLRELHWAPRTPAYGADADRIFAALPSPIPTLVEGATMARVDSRQCPALGRALLALDRRQINWRTDMTEVGTDGRSEPPAADSNYAYYTLNIRAPRGIVTLEGSGEALGPLVGPVVRAADGCLGGQGGDRWRQPQP